MESIIDSGTADALGALFSKFLQSQEGAILLEPILSKILKPRVQEIELEVDIPIVEEKCEEIVTSNFITAHLPDNSDAKRPVALINRSKPPRVIYVHKLPRIKYSFEPIGSSLFFIDAFLYHVHDPGPLILFSSTRKSRVPNFGEFSSLRESAG